MLARFHRATVLAAGVTLLITPAATVWAGAPQRYTLAQVRELLAARVGESLGPPGGEIRSLALAPSDSRRLYAGTSTGHLYRSDDAAASWSELSVFVGHDSVVDNLLIHPADPDTVYAAYWEAGGDGGLLRTTDGGASWNKLAIPGEPSLRAIAMAPTQSDTLYVGGIGGVWRSDDAGESWRNINGDGLVTEFIESLAVDPRDPEHVYAGTWRQVYRSRDGGSSWSRIYQGMAVDRDIFSIAISPHDPNVVLAGTCNFLYSSNNAGGTWAERRDGLSPQHNRIHNIVHDPFDDQLLFAGTRGGLYRSDDAGVTWRILLGGVSVTDLVLDPSSRRMYVATEERGVLVGDTEGTLLESNVGIASSRVIAFDALPGAPRVLFAARSDGPGSYSIHYSTDVGQTWNPLGSTPAIGEIRALRAQAQPLNRVLVVGQTGWWSVFPGGRWIPVDAPPGTLYDFEIAHDAGGIVVAATSEGLFVAAAEALDTGDGAARPFDADAAVVWRPLWTGGEVTALTIGGTRVLALGPTAAIVADLAQIDSAGAAASTSHTGLEGEIVGAGLHPDDPQIAYAISSKQVFRSANGGRSWERLPLPWSAGELRAVAVDPARPDQVLALDYGGALYRGHGEGQHWLVLDQDPALDRAWTLRLSAEAPGLALVATQGHGLRIISLDLIGDAPATDAAEANR